MADAARRVARQLAHATLLPPLYRALTGRDEPKAAARLGGLLDLLLADPAFPEAARSLAGNGARWSALWPGLRDRLPTQGQHHLALLETRQGWNQLTQDPSAATRHFTNALEHWAPVLEDRTYIEAFSAACGLDPSQAGAAELARWVLTPHVSALASAIAEPAQFDERLARPHWHVLERAQTRLPAGRDEAALQRSILVEQVLEQVSAMAAELEPLKATDAELTAPIETLRRLTGGVGIHEDLSIWALERAVQWAWPLYKTRSLERLGKLMDAVRPFGMHVEEMLLRGDGAFGRQSLCADFLLFLADNAQFDEQEPLFRRGLAVCPGHRNSRLMLSYHKLREANAVLIRAEAPPGLSEVMLGRTQFRQTVSDARALVDQAEELFAPNPKIPDYRRRVEKLEVRRK